MVDLNKALAKALNADDKKKLEPARWTPTPLIEGESDLDFCKRKFGGKEFKCRGCDTTIYWPGACDECVEKFTEATMSDFDKIRHIGVPFRLAECTWSNFKKPSGLKHHELLNEIKELENWRGEPPLAILSGRPGTGKAHMAVATIWRRLRIAGMYGCRFYQERTLLERLKAGFDTKGDDMLEKVSNLKFLVIDDFGHTRMTEWVMDTMFGLVSRRFDEGRVTLITTNLTHIDINEIDPRLGSRLHQALAVGTSSMPDYRKGKPNGKPN